MNPMQQNYKWTLDNENNQMKFVDTQIQHKIKWHSSLREPNSLTKTQFSPLIQPNAVKEQCRTRQGKHSGPVSHSGSARHLKGWNST